ncbi:MAG: HupE/UreJ family protein [Pseudomonadota bacterium]
MSLRSLPQIALCGALVALMPSAALAHAEVAVGAGLVNGLMHPILGPDHLVAMVAVGLWGAQLRAPLIWALPVAFPLMMAVGGVLGVIGVDLPAVEIGIAVSALALGLLVALAVKAPNAAAVAVVSVFAIFHGHAHGTELPHAATPIAYGLGFVLSTGLLHVSGIAIGLLDKIKPMGGSIVRGCGGIVALVGLYYLLRAVGAL